MEEQLPEVVKMGRNQVLLRILDEIADRRVKDLLGREDEMASAGRPLVLG